MNNGLAQITNHWVINQVYIYNWLIFPKVLRIVMNPKIKTKNVKNGWEISSQWDVKKIDKFDSLVYWIKFYSINWIKLSNGPTHNINVFQIDKNRWCCFILISPNRFVVNFISCELLLIFICFCQNRFHKTKQKCEDYFIACLFVEKSLWFIYNNTKFSIKLEGTEKVKGSQM